VTHTGGWFAAELVLEAEHPDEPDFRERLFERRVVLFAGRDEAEAERKASEYCQGSEFTYENQYGARVVWKCLRVLAVTPLYVDELRDGVEVYSDLLDTEPGPATPKGPAA